MGHEPGFPAAGTRLVRVLFGSDQEARQRTSAPSSIRSWWSSIFIRSGSSSSTTRKGQRTSRFRTIRSIPAVRGAASAARPIVATQPDGRNFVVDGNVVTCRAGSSASGSIPVKASFFIRSRSTTMAAGARSRIAHRCHRSSHCTAIPAISGRGWNMTMREISGSATCRRTCGPGREVSGHGRSP